MATAETLMAIYSEAWHIHCNASGGGGDVVEELPIGIPHWMAKRSPKEQLWTLVVYNTLFKLDEKVTWARNAFVILYKQLRELFNKYRHQDTDDFDRAFHTRVGRYITVMFNPDKSKKVNTSHGAKHGLHSLSSFFKVQFWAPLINPHRYVLDEQTVSWLPIRLRQYLI